MAPARRGLARSRCDAHCRGHDAGRIHIAPSTHRCDPFIPRCPVKVFITGATGVLGKTVSRLLIDAGHDVRGLARNAGSESRIRGLGIEPVPASLFDPPSLRRAMQGCDAVLHLATRIPPPNQARRREAWSENDRIRIEGTWNLVDVALESP